MSKFDPVSISKDGLTVELLRAFQLRLDAVVVSVRQMRDIAMGQKHAFRRLDALEGMHPADVAAALPTPEGLQDLKQVIQLISQQSAAIDCVARLIDLMATRLHHPLQALREIRPAEAAGRASAQISPPDSPPAALDDGAGDDGAGDDDGTLPARNQTAEGLDSAVILLFDGSKNQAAAARKAAAEIGEVFEMLAVIEEQATALAGAQALTTDMLRTKLGALVTT
ncbi:MAG TPA: hypothetical protein VM639_12635 [Dongiaceae bacterium]|nr:hypothetical protein [Dongiaceae bacterium]